MVIIKFLAGSMRSCFQFDSFQSLCGEKAPNMKHSICSMLCNWFQSISGVQRWVSHITELEYGLEWWNGLWNFVYSRRHLSNFFHLFPLCQTSGEPPLLKAGY